MKTHVLIGLDGFCGGEFSVQPVTIREFTGHPAILPFEDILPTGSQILLDETAVAWFLLEFFKDYYDVSLSYNIRCCEYYDEDPHFEFNLNDNLYRYTVFQNMLEAILVRVTELKALAKIYEPDLQFKQLQEYWGINHPFWDLLGTVQDNLNAVIQFYEDFVEYSHKIMNENPQADLISISGP